MDDKLIELKFKIKEIKSCMIILQQAIQNKNDIVTFEHIDDNLEILIEKLISLENEI